MNTLKEIDISANANLTALYLSNNKIMNRGAQALALFRITLKLV